MKQDKVGNLSEQGNREALFFKGACEMQFSIDFSIGLSLSLSPTLKAFEMSFGGLLEYFEGLSKAV